MSKKLSVTAASDIRVTSLTPSWNGGGWTPPSAAEIYLVIQRGGFESTKQVAQFLNCEPRSVTRWLNHKQNTPIGYADWCLLCDAAGMERFWLRPQPDAYTTEASLPRDILHLMRQSRCFGRCSALDVATVLYSGRALMEATPRDNDGLPLFVVGFEKIDLKYLLGTANYKRVLEYCQRSFPVHWMDALSTRLRNLLLGNGLFELEVFYRVYDTKPPEYWQHLQGMGTQTLTELVAFASQRE